MLLLLHCYQSLIAVRYCLVPYNLIKQHLLNLDFTVKRMNRFYVYLFCVVAKVKRNGSVSHLHLNVVQLVNWFISPQGVENSFKRAISCFRDLVQWKPLNVIMVNFISCLLWSDCSGPICWALYCNRLLKKNSIIVPVRLTLSVYLGSKVIALNVFLRIITHKLQIILLLLNCLLTILQVK